MSKANLGSVSMCALGKKFIDILDFWSLGCEILSAYYF